MNPIGLVLDALLLGMLAWALALGLKLNGRLKALRDGQEGFAKAVTELDVASRRAEAGLADMRHAAEETHDGLQSRIEIARGLLIRLEAASEGLAARPPSVTGFAGDTSPASRERGDRRSSPLPRSGGGGSVRSAETEGARVGARFDPDDPAPTGFADMIRRTLREPR